MNNGKKDTLTEVWLQKIKNNRIVAVLIIVSVVVAGIATFTESAKKIYQAFFLSQVTESKDITIPVSNIEIKVLPVTVNKEALIRPHAVSFEMRNGENYFSIRTMNFPMSKSLNWNPNFNSEVLIEVEVRDQILQRKYPGFREFLSEFYKGNCVFRPDDFKADQAEFLKRKNIDFISLSFLIRGAESIMEYQPQ